MPFPWLKKTRGKIFILPILKLSSLFPHAFAWWFNCYSDKEQCGARGTLPSIPLQLAGMSSPTLVQMQGTSSMGLEIRPQHLSSDLSCVIWGSEVFASVNLSVTYSWQNTVAQCAGLANKTGGVFDVALLNPTHLLKVEKEFITTLQMRTAYIASPTLSVNAVWNGQTNDGWLNSNKTNLVMIFPRILPSLVDHIMMWGRDVKLKVFWVLNHSMFIDKMKYPNPFLFLSVFLANILRHSLQPVYPQLILPRISKESPLLSKVCSTVNGWCTLISQIWIITDLGQQL